MKFKCQKDAAHKFEVEPPQDKIGVLWSWRGVVHCPYCGTIDLMEDLVPGNMGTGIDLSKARRENREATMAAQQMAGKARAEQDARDPEVTLAPIQGASKFGKSAPVKVRKSIMDTIASKTPDNAFPSQ